jgi:site-specific DNA-methyltransferase (adenine-specific)
MDCIEGIKKIDNNSIDMIFTDPPYKLVSGGRKNSLLKDTEDTPFSNNGECFEVKTPEFKEWIPQLYDKLKDGRYLFIMTNDRNMREIWDLCEQSGFRFCELLVMNKGKGVPSTYFYKSCEFILMFMKGKYRKFNRFGTKTVFEVDMPRGKNKVHPTEKPVNMIEDIITSVTLENEIIFDPFMGGGSTGLAATSVGRQYIGFELDSIYCNTAEKRINNTYDNNITQVSK